MAIISAFQRDENGATVVEYGLIAAVLSFVIVAGFGQAADALQFLFGSSESKLQQAIR
jgi:Flp pilus assembly pilin Flp